MNVWKAVMGLTAGLLTVCVAYTLFFYPLMTSLYNVFSSGDIIDTQLDSYYNTLLLIAGFFGAFITVGLFVWAVLYLSKKEVFEWQRLR